MAQGEIFVDGYHWDGRIQWYSSPIEGQNASLVQADFYTDGFGGNGTFWGMLTMGDTSQETSWNGLGSEICIGSMQCTVAHDDQGNASLYIGMRCLPPQSHPDIGDELQGGETVTLDQIRQAGPSRIRFSQTEIQMEKHLLISIDRDQPDCIHRLTYQFGGHAGVIGKKLQTSGEWLVPDLTAYCMDALSGICTVTCITFRDGRLLGETSGKITLKVPDPTVPQLSEGELGREATVLTPRKSPHYKISLRFLCEKESIALGEGKADSFPWTPSYDIARLKPDLKKISGQLEAKTWLGSALVGTSTCALRLNVPENEHTRPVISEFTLTPIPGKLPEDFPLIRGKSGLQSHLEASSPCSEIAELTVTIGQQQAFGTDGRIDCLTQAGTLTAVARAEDLRGFAWESRLPVTVLPYEKPRCVPYEGFDQIVCSRADSLDILNPTGTGLAIYAGQRFTEIKKDGTNLNPCTLSYRMKKQGETGFSPWKILVPAGEKQKKLFLPLAVEDLTSSYQVELSCRDALGEQEKKLLNVMSKAVSFSLYDGVDGAAFGKFAEQAHVVDIAPHMTLQVRGKISLPPRALAGDAVLTVNGKTPDGGGNAVLAPEDLENPSDQTLDGWLDGWLRNWLCSWNLEKNYPVGRLWISDDPTDPSKIVGGTWKRLEDLFLLAAGPRYPAGTEGGEASHVLTEEELPSHSHKGLSYLGKTPIQLNPGTLPGYALTYQEGVGYEESELSSGSAGTGTAHNNMPPYRAVYVWQRIQDPAEKTISQEENYGRKET